jgi:uncharacterized membrane protein
LKILLKSMDDLQKTNNQDPQSSENSEDIGGQDPTPTFDEVRAIEEKLLEANPKIFQGVEKNKRSQIISTVAQVTFHQGPLPHPEQLVGYAKIINNGAERIMVMAETSLKANIESRKESQSLARYHANQTFSIIKNGQWMGFLLVLLFVGLGSYMTIDGHETFGQCLIGTTLVSVAGMFIWSVFGKRPTNEKTSSAPPDTKGKRK